MRRMQAVERRSRVCELLESRQSTKGAGASIGRELGVHRSTISRDIKAILHSLKGIETNLVHRVDNRDRTGQRTSVAHG